MLIGFHKSVSIEDNKTNAIEFLGMYLMYNEILDNQTDEQFYQILHDWPFTNCKQISLSQPVSSSDESLFSSLWNNGCLQAWWIFVVLLEMSTYSAFLFCNYLNNDRLPVS